MKIGIFSFGQPLAGQVRDAVEQRRPGSVLWVDLADTVSGLAIDPENLTWRGEALTTLDKVWVNGFRYTNPVMPPPMEGADWSVWQYGYLAEQQRWSACYSLLCELVRRGVAVWHGPGLYMGDFMKHAQLASLGRAGLSIPPLVCVNTPEDAAAFGARWPQVVWRPATGRAAWQLFQRKQRLALADPGKAPILLAEAREGHLLRVYMLAGRPILCLKQYAPANQAPHETLERLHLMTPPRVAELEQAAAVVGLRWGVFTCLWDEERLSFYDVDPDPVLDWLPAVFRDHLVAALAAALAETAPPPALDIDLPLERPNLFLRRMTRILYDFENSKYRE